MKHLIDREYILKTTKDQKGYMRVVLRKDGSFLKRYGVHRIVAETFIPNPENKPQVDHINGIRHCNVVDNLRWCTTKENQTFDLARQKQIASHNHELSRQ